MPIYKTKNENFFKEWSPRMAYVLGFFAADGSMTKNKRGAHFIEIEITDRDLLEKIQKILGSNHKISLRKGSKKWADAYRLQIGSKIIFQDLLNLGIFPKKAKRLALPNIPHLYLPHFVRGYFDGDGGVWYGFTHKKDRKNPARMLLSTFTSCSKMMLEGISKVLFEEAGTRLKNLTFRDGAFRLNYSTNDSRKIYKFIYNSHNGLYLNRKKIIFEKYLGA